MYKDAPEALISLSRKPSSLKSTGGSLKLSVDNNQDDKNKKCEC